VLDGFRDPHSPWRAELEASLPEATGFSHENVREGLTRALADWSGDALRALVARELDDGRAEGFACTAVLLAGSIPMPTLLSLLAPLVLRSPVLAKCASRDPVTGPLVARAVAEVDAELGACVDAVSVPSGDAEAMQALLEADCVLATGSDETIAAVRERVGEGQRLVSHGHRLSLAALGDAATRGDTLSRAAEGLAVDVALWDQLGCLSPIAVYVASPDPQAADRAAEALAAELARAETRWPRGCVETAAAARFANERAEAELRAAANPRVSLLADPELRWTVVREADARPRPAPLHRFLRVQPVPDEAALLDAIAPLARHLAAVAVAGFGKREAELVAALARLGASRTCPPGQLQTPPLDWRNDGRGVLAPLARSGGREHGGERAG
jgi:hypothetical protein